MFKLKGDIHPLIFRDLARGKEFKGIVKRSGIGYLVKLLNDEGNYIDSYAVHTNYNTDGIHNDMEVVIALDGAYLSAFTIEENYARKQKEKRWLEEMQKREEESKRMKEERLRIKEENEKRYIEECITFYQDLKLDAKYTPVYRVTKSGLLEGSMGDGMYKNTVYHLRLDEDFSDGKRFYRKSGDSLCKCNLKGRLVLEEEVAEFMYEGLTIRHKISCKSCLKILKSKGLIKE